MKITATDEWYFLIFYKDDLVYGDKLEIIQTGSFIDSTIQKGIVLQSNHPLLPVIIPHNIVSIPNRQTLFSKLQAKYTLLEIAYLATTLDSFFTKDQLNKSIDKIFFHYRRKGSFFKAFQILKVLSNFSPEFNAAQERLHSQEFSSYVKWYHSSPLSLIYEKDPLFVEHDYFNNRITPDTYESYVHFLNEQGRSIDLLLLWLDRVAVEHKTDSIDLYTNRALQFISLEDWMAVLSYVNVNPLQLLPKQRRLSIKCLQRNGMNRLHIICFASWMTCPHPLRIF